MKNSIHKILIVDDDPNQVQLLKLYLKNLNLNISTAVNGRHAIHLLKDNTFDLILTDFQMPEMDGETLISKIRNELKLLVPIVMISANDKQPNISMYKNINILRKPFTRDEINKILNLIK